MNRIIALTAATLIGTTAMAGTSTRYDDLRLDTANEAQSAFYISDQSSGLDRAQRGQDQRFAPMGDRMALSTRATEARTPGEGYVYGGFGPGNDSR